jgi:20S proteasome subunit beta 1
VANRVSDKLTEVHDRIYCCRSGSAADTQAITGMVHGALQQHAVDLGRLPKVSTAAHLFRQPCYQHKDKLSAGIIVAGWDEVEGGQVYCIPMGGTLHRQAFSIGGSGSTYIYGHCDAAYKPGMTLEECKDFVKTALSLAMGRDGSSGGVIRMVSINKEGVTREFTPGNKLPYMDSNEGQYLT